MLASIFTSDQSIIQWSQWGRFFVPDHVSHFGDGLADNFPLLERDYPSDLVLLRDGCLNDLAQWWLVVENSSHVHCIRISLVVLRIDEARNLIVVFDMRQIVILQLSEAVSDAYCILISGLTWTWLALRDSQFRLEQFVGEEHQRLLAISRS